MTVKSSSKAPSTQTSKQSVCAFAKFTDARQQMKASLIERAEEIDIVLTALVSRENPLLVGPPGTAKSMLMDSLLAWMGPDTRLFSVLFNKFTTPEEVFGPISVQGLKNDEYRRITTGKLPDAHIGFADEIFKASSAILNTLLKIINERSYDNGAGLKQVPLQIFLAASNEWPSQESGGKELGALFDRFLFRKKVRPVQTPEGLQRLLWSTDLSPKFAHKLTLLDVQNAQQEAADLPFSGTTKSVYIKILNELRQAGIIPGDRRIRKSVRACQAYSWLNGNDEVSVTDLEILKHIFWEDPGEQVEKVGRIVGMHTNPTKVLINDKILIAADVIAKNVPADAVPKLRALMKDLEVMGVENPDVSSALDTLEAMTKQQWERVLSS